MKCSAEITVRTGRRGSRAFTVERVESFATTQSIDVDSDSFSIDIGDVGNELGICLDRDNEAKVDLFLTYNGRKRQIFSGIADNPQRHTDSVLSLAGRDLPSSIADSDCPPFKVKHFRPDALIAKRASAVGIKRHSIAHMSQITKSFWTDGSEKEWAVWYRLARMKGMYMWSGPLGGLVVGKLAYSLRPAYKFGHGEGYLPVSDVSIVSTKQSRIKQVWGYGQNVKKARAFVAKSTDPHIASWQKKPLSIFVSSTAHTPAALKKETDEEVFESIVGAQEIELTMRDSGVLIEQNAMARVHLPEHGIDNELWFVVGVQRMGGPEGMTYIIRLREKGFALTKRVPTAPVLGTSKFPSDINKPAASIEQSLAEQLPGLKGLSQFFVEATHIHGDGWDTALFLAVLLSIGHVESGGTFANVREVSGKQGAVSGGEWYAFDANVEGGVDAHSRASENDTADRDAHGRASTTRGTDLPRQNFDLWRKAFANAADNPLNPFYPREAGVGCMQLTSIGIKRDADEIGWGTKASGGAAEYYGARWNPRSNIIAAAKALAAFLNYPPAANPGLAETIWVGVARYNAGSRGEITKAGQVYAAKVRQQFNAVYRDVAIGSISTAQSVPSGSATRSFKVPDHGLVTLPAQAPAEAAKALTFAYRHLGDLYVWGAYGQGSPPRWDCSSFVTAALASGSSRLHNLLLSTGGLPDVNTRTHGQTTYTLWRLGTKVARDKLLPGDLVFFRGDPPEHVGIYLDDDLFIQDSSSRGVIVSGLSEDYYRERYSGARRLIEWRVLPDYEGAH